MNSALEGIRPEARQDFEQHVRDLARIEVERVVGAMVHAQVERHLSDHATPITKCLTELRHEIRHLAQAIAASGERNMAPPDSMSVDEAGRRLGCRRTRIFELLKDGRLLPSPEKFGREKRVLGSSVTALLSSGAPRKTAPRRSVNQRRPIDGAKIADAIGKIRVD